MFNFEYYNIQSLLSQNSEEEANFSFLQNFLKREYNVYF